MNLTNIISGEQRTLLRFVALLPAGGMDASVFNQICQSVRLAVKVLIEKRMIIENENDKKIALGPCFQGSIKLDTSFFEMHPFILALFQYVQRVNEDRDKFWFPDIDLSAQANHLAQLEEHLAKLTKDKVGSDEYSKVWDEASILVKQCKTQSIISCEQREIALKYLKEVDYWYCLAETMDRIDRLYESRYEGDEICFQISCDDKSNEC